MEKKLKVLFDYQRFKGTRKLAKMIAEVESQYREEISDDDLSIVSAAGEPLSDISENKDDDNGSST